MKKFLLIFISIFILCGCAKNDESGVTNKISKKIEDTAGYKMTGVLTIYKDENIYTYDVISSYSNKDYYKVSLTNQTNNHEQVILKNSNGVFVLTPSLRKSFKFQSEWPYNNSQIYILKQLLNDIKKDEKRVFETTDEGYVFTTSVNYSNDKSLNQQKIYFDTSYKLTKVEVMNSDNDIKMQLIVNELDMSANFDDEYFAVDSNYDTSESDVGSKKEQKDSEEDDDNNQNSANEQANNDDTSQTTECQNDSTCSENCQNNCQTKTTSQSNSVIYPMYVPTETYLSSQDVVSTDDSERIILTFAGESPFILVQETNNRSDLETEYIYGDPCFVVDSIGALTDYSVTWINGTTEYYLVSDVMSQDELLNVAQSVNVLAVGK